VHLANIGSIRHALAVVPDLETIQSTALREAGVAHPFVGPAVAAYSEHAVLPLPPPYEAIATYMSNAIKAEIQIKAEASGKAALPAAT
jgi:hypothetical protein